MPMISLNLPKECQYNQFIPKKQFYEHGNFTQADKNIFIHGVERITLYAQLTRENTNIETYKDEVKTYEEIQVFLVELKQKESIEKAAKLIMDSIPYPMILIGLYEETYNFYGAHQRDNQLDKNKVIKEKTYRTGFIDANNDFIKQIDYQKMSKNNLYSFYEDYIQAIIQYNLASRNVEYTENSEAVLHEIERLEEQISSLKSKLKKEVHFNKKMELNMKIKKIEKKLEEMRN